ncbi:hypothetical protein [Arthrobacter sp. IK3]|uniref:hypothetical protein n=1 Tax=Arthrobacter sp. IK3 TaxID=3448169 RepID=UPI003EDFB4A7
MRVTHIATGPAKVHRRLWEISYEGQCAAFHSTARKAGTALVDLLTRRMMKGHPARTITVKLLDEHDEVLWDATSDVADVLTATGWPGRNTDRDAVIDVLEAILVTDEPESEDEALIAA